MKNFCATGIRVYFSRRHLHRRGWRSPFQLGAFRRQSQRRADIPVSLAALAGFFAMHLRASADQRHHHSSPPIYPSTTPNTNNSADSSQWHELIRLRDAARAAIGRFSGEPML